MNSMQNVINKKTDIWKRPWDIEKFDTLAAKDERFFALVAKGVLSWLNRNVKLYGKGIKHFIFNTGSSVLYIESNGYSYSMKETTGEDWMYMERPRCTVQMGNVSIPTEELTNPFVRGIYERISSEDNQMHGYNAEIRRIPMEISWKLNYVLSDFNEGIVLMQELIDRLLFQRYFSIVYLGQTIKCSIEFSQDTNLEINQVDLSSGETEQITLLLDIKVCTNYPCVDERTEERNDRGVIATFNYDIMHKRHEIDDEIRVMTYGSSIYRKYVEGWYDKFLKKFRGQDQQIIDAPETTYIYYDLTDNRRMRWDGKQWLRVPDEDAVRGFLHDGQFYASYSNGEWKDKIEGNPNELYADMTGNAFTKYKWIDDEWRRVFSFSYYGYMGADNVFYKDPDYRIAYENCSYNSLYIERDADGTIQKWSYSPDGTFTEEPGGMMISGSTLEVN